MSARFFFRFRSCPKLFVELAVHLEEIHRLTAKGRFFFRTKFKSLVVVCGTLERRHGRRLVKKGAKKKGRKEGIKGEEAKDRPDRTISPSRRWVKLHHYTRRDVCFHVKPKRDERQRVFFVFEKREQRE